MSNPRKFFCGCNNDPPSTMDYLTKSLQAAKVDLPPFPEKLRIPVVFHICYEFQDNEEGRNNIQADIDYSMEIINEDFQNRGRNKNHGQQGYQNSQFRELYLDYANRSASSNLEFFHQSTKYVPLPVQSGGLFELNDRVKNASPVDDPARKLNVWVVEMQGGLLGFGQFAWVSKYRPSTDGVLIAKGSWGRILIMGLILS